MFEIQVFEHWCLIAMRLLCLGLHIVSSDCQSLETAEQKIPLGLLKTSEAHSLAEPFGESLSRTCRPNLLVLSHDLLARGRSHHHSFDLVPSGTWEAFGERNVAE